MATRAVSTAGWEGKKPKEPQTGRERVYIHDCGVAAASGAKQPELRAVGTGPWAEWHLISAGFLVLSARRVVQHPRWLAEQTAPTRLLAALHQKQITSPTPTRLDMLVYLGSLCTSCVHAQDGHPGARDHPGPCQSTLSNRQREVHPLSAGFDRRASCVSSCPISYGLIPCAQKHAHFLYIAAGCTNEWCRIFSVDVPQ